MLHTRHLAIYTLQRIKLYTTMPPYPLTRLILKTMKNQTSMGLQTLRTLTIRPHEKAHKAISSFYSEILLTGKRYCNAALLNQLLKLNWLLSYLQAQSYYNSGDSSRISNS